MRHFKALFVGLVVAINVGLSQAALVDLGNQTVKDEGTNLIWLKDWNLNGLNDYATSKSWAEALNFGGSNDWVLPTRQQLIDLAIAWAPLNSTNTPFINAIPNGGYWTTTVFVGDPSKQWDFAPPYGFSSQTPADLSLFAVAVRSGDTVNDVPEPETLALTLAALGALALVRPRRSGCKSLT